MQRTTLRSSRSAAKQLFAHILDPYIDPRGLQYLLLCYSTSTVAHDRLELHVFATRQESYTRPNVAGFTLVSLCFAESGARRAQHKEAPADSCTAY